MTQKTLIPSLLIFGFSLFAMAWSDSLFAIEVPEFKVIEETEEIQIRQYPELLVARTKVSAGFKQAGNEGFRRLGGYIFGGNEGEQKISMTAPVSQSAAGEGEYWVTFFMPSEHSLESLPVPLDANVELTTLPGATFAVRKYRGGWSEDRYRSHEQQLFEWLESQENWQQVGPAVWSRYNPPFVPGFMKTNEVMVPVEPR